MLEHVGVVCITCRIAVLRQDQIDFVRLRDIQLTSVGNLLEVCALVEGTAQTCLPHRGVCFVSPLSKFPLVYGPCLQSRNGEC